VHDHDLSNRDATVIPRRRLLKASASLVVGASALGLPLRALAAGVAPEHMDEWLALFAPSTPGATPAVTPISVANYTPVALTVNEFATLQAMVDRVIPTDDLGPGAADAGAHVYIDRSLKGPNAALLPVYKDGLAALDKAASGGFATASADQRDMILTTAEGGKLDGAPDGFFALVLEHTRQGMFGDPIYGGNIGFAGWDLIGYPGIKLTWSAEDQKFDVQVKPEHTSVAKYGGTGQ